MMQWCTRMSKTDCLRHAYKNCDGRYFLRVETSDDDYVVPLTGAEADAYLYKYGRKRI